MSIIWTILIGFVVGLVARFVMPGRNAPKGFILTSLLGIGGSMFATYFGQYLGLYHAGEVAGFIGAVIGSMLLILVWRSIKG
jgi:uncharacterized membrane protein YeaQ/YmgE (transglycosylase-associated protein family)